MEAGAVTKDKMLDMVTRPDSPFIGEGKNEIDLIALNDLDKTAIVAEVKRNPKKIDMTLLQAKADSIKKELAKY